MKLPAIIVGLIVATSAASADSLKSVCAKMGNRASVALAHKNFKAFAAAVKPYATADFKYVERGQSMDLSHMIEGIKQGIGPMHVTGAHYKSLSCNEHGKTGTTRSLHSLSATMPGPDKKPHKIVASITSNDSWVKLDGAWKMSTMTVVSQKMTRDGKPFNPEAGAPQPHGATRPRK